MPEQNAPEPTMEEILASIRRIITEEDPPVDSGAFHSAAAPGAVTSEPAAEATPDEPEAASTPHLAPAKVTAQAPWNGEMPVNDPEPDSYPAPVAAPPEPATIVYTPTPPEPSVFAKPITASEPMAPEPPAPAYVAPAASDKTPTADLDAPLVSPQASAETASAFSRLTAAVKVAPKESSVMLPVPGRTLEDLTRELLRPLLQTWLDENLPEIVRQQVEEEVARIARGRTG